MLRLSWWGARAAQRPLGSSGTGPRGQVAVLFAIAAVAIIGMAGLALDAGLSYMGQTGLQSASDNASLAVARMLGADYSSQFQQPAPVVLPWGYVQIQAAVQQAVAANGAGTTRATSYAAYFTYSDGTKICQFWPVVGSTCLTDFPGSGGIPETAAGVVAAAGAEVVASNTHGTSLMNVLGIGKASEAAPATAIFQVTNGGASEPFAAYFACADGNPNQQVAVGDTVIYYESNHWTTDAACSSSSTDSSFKGDFKPGTFSPPNFTAPGWASVGAGNGSWTANITNGEEFLIPMIDCINKNAWCTEPAGNTYCASSSQSAVPQVPGGWDMCVMGLIAIRATPNPHDPSGNCTGPSSNECTGVVVPYISGQAGVLVCPGNGQPNCGGETGAKGAIALNISLLH